MVEIGIDLGTSNSLIGYFDQAKHVANLIPNRFGKLLTPSVVSVDEQGEIVVGEIAKTKQLLYPDRTAKAFKRFMGTEMLYHLSGKTFSPVELSSFVLMSLKEDAEIALNQEITDVVISVPAYFNAFQREATLSAAKLAKLNVVQLISEPTAAAIAYGIENETEDQNFLIADLGGGTFDVSLISMFEQIIQVEAISGDSQLGGEDFTQAIMTAALSQAGLRQSEASPALLADLYNKAEKLKQRFAENTTLAAGFDFQVNHKKVSFKLTSAAFRELVMPLLARLQKPTRRVMNDSDMDFDQLDKVILVGGATRVKVVQQAFSKITQMRPSIDLNPEQAVALGATIRAHMLNDKSRQELIMTDVIGFSLDTDAYSSKDAERPIFLPIIERNATIPASKEKSVCKMKADQKNVKIAIYQGEKPYPEDNLKLGEISYPVAALDENDPIYIRYSYDESGILEVDVTDPKQNFHKNLIIQNRHVKLSDTELKKIQQKLQCFKINPLEQDENKLILARFEQLYSEFVGFHRHHLLREQQHFIREIKTNNSRRINEARKRANKILENFEELL